MGSTIWTPLAAAYGWPAVATGRARWKAEPGSPSTGAAPVSDPSFDPELPKSFLYQEIRLALHALLEGESDPIARMASAAAVLYRALSPRASFVGFYRVVEPGLLVIGPYQGPVACLRIPFDRGVCGAAARQREPILVPDVHAFPGHIACDAGARSELVVPVFDPSGNLLAVLDLDSHEPAAFDSEDQTEVVRLMAEVFAHH